MNNNKIAFPHISSYYIPIKYIIKKITKADIIIPKLNNEETIQIGSRYSPCDICMPFKYNVGNYIDALNKGANILIQAGGGCRYGYYAELEEQILRELGYNFNFINLIKDNHISLIKLYKEAKKINNKLNVFQYIYYLLQVFLIIIYLDNINRYKRENKVLLQKENEIELLLNKLKKIYSSDNLTIYKILKAYQITKKNIKKISKKNINPTKILIIGELYTIMDEAANHNLEETLIKNGSIIYRYTDLTYLLLKKRFVQKKILFYSRKYIKYNLGADGAESVYHALKHSKNSIDGIIHIKSYGCVPELNAIPVLNRISEEYKVPIMYLSFDGENNIANIDTKIEAFYDMIKSKKQIK